MIKYLKFIVILLVCTSCNSNEKKNTESVKPKNEPIAVNSVDESKTIEIVGEQDLVTLKAESIVRGKGVYSDMCVTCHLADGKGVPRAFPPLVDSDYLREKQDVSIKGVKKGMSGEIVVNGVTYNSVMSPLGLSDIEVADVMNYINNAWGNEIDNYVTPEKVSKL